MKLLASTLGLLQLGATASALLPERRQLQSDPSEHNSEYYEEIAAICMPMVNEMIPKSDTPCGENMLLSYECTFGELPPNPEKVSETPPPKELDPAAQQDCICGSDYWSLFKGCSDCYRLHGGREGADFYPEEVGNSISASYCSGTATLGFPNFLFNAFTENSFPIASTRESDVLGTQTAVSLYYTATGEATATGAETGTAATATAATATGTGTGTAAATGTDPATTTGAASSLHRDASLVAGVALAVGLFV